MESTVIIKHSIKRAVRSRGLVQLKIKKNPKYQNSNHQLTEDRIKTKFDIDMSYENLRDNSLVFDQLF